MKKRGTGYYLIMAAAWTMLAVLFSSPFLRADSSLPILEITWLIAGFHWALLAYLLIFRKRGNSSGSSSAAPAPAEPRDPDAT